MDKKELMKLIESLEKTNWNKLEICEKGFSLKMERGITYAAPTVVQPIAAPPVVQAAAVPVPAAQPAAAPTEADEEERRTEEEEAPAVPNGCDLRSPLVGIFHKAGDVGVGSALKKGDVVCMIEAMKLMNEVAMPEDGEIYFVAAEEGDMVEYDQILARYTKK